METIITQIRETLIASADENTRKQSEYFFKEQVTVYGVKSATVQKIAKDIFTEIKDKTKAEILDACENLWQSGYMEDSFVACVWSEKLGKKLEPADFETLERWIKNYVSNWASCDTLCNHTVGDFVMKYPEFIAKLKEFARSENRWVKRAAAVALIIPARKGLFQKEIFEIADILLMDSDDLVQKGYGWMLKAASQAHQQEVFEYVMSRKAVMPRTALRYAIEKMPEELRKQAMQK
ncbi:MAG TPA: DNA alkylation repair protein [Prolixibacteraceae bacterium]|nr:DNA alkylation repair protein [Prolixibacteraceae bacterium]